KTSEETSKQEEKNTLKLVIKEEEPAGEEPFKIGDHYLTPEELEEKRRFEEQKRAFEERAERLRKLSFNIKGAGSTDDMENVPAYIRKNRDIDNDNMSSSQHFSGYSIGMNDPKNQNQASIQTINTFLDG